GCRPHCAPMNSVGSHDNARVAAHDPLLTGRLVTWGLLIFIAEQHAAPLSCPAISAQEKAPANRGSNTD
ncbi:hypothetical protein OAS86_03930, partial [Gammaproteobacteria bacterium]|nr:hypothetical protein [Gammaproteobacteria bacterium]